VLLGSDGSSLFMFTCLFGWLVGTHVSKHYIILVSMFANMRHLRRIVVVTVSINQISFIKTVCDLFIL
jgi:hypothetical protein